MITAGYYIDDAGTPGAKTQSRFLHESRKSWCAVIVPERAAQALRPALAMFLGGVKQDYGVDELHFTDVYGGRGNWSGVPVEKRVEMFDLMTQLFMTFRMPVIFQTVSPSTFADHAEFFSGVKSRPGQFWNVKDIAHFGLLVTCFHISRYFDYLRSEYPSDFPGPLPAYVDEGLAKSGAEIDLPNWDRAIHGGKLFFRRSVDKPGLQLADFAAFSISRAQWISAQKPSGTPLSRGDRHIMNISGKLNVFNLDQVVIDPANFSREDYEHYQRRDRAAKGLTEYPSPDS